MSDIHVIFNFIYSSTQIKKCDKNNWLQNFEKLLGKCLYHRFFSECNMFRKLAVIKRAFWASLHYKGYHARILQDSSFQNFANFSARYFWDIHSFPNPLIYRLHLYWNWTCLTKIYTNTFNSKGNLYCVNGDYSNTDAEMPMPRFPNERNLIACVNISKYLSEAAKILFLQILVLSCVWSFYQ